VKTWADPIPAAVERLRAGGLVAFPTETVYGLGADALDPAAVAAIFRLKGRPADHPLIVHLPRSAPLEDWAREIPEAARDLAGRFWPGPLTLVLARRPRVPDAVTGGQDTVALRVPDHPLALELLAAFGSGIAAPSANRFGRVSPTRAEHVRAEFGAAAPLILDGGPCRVGLESTILDLSDAAPRLLRPGAVGARELEGVMGRPLAAEVAGAPRTPGALPAHYAPRARVILAAGAGEGLARARAEAARGARVGLLGAWQGALPAGVADLRLPAAPDAQARVLYDRLRQADRLGLEVVVALPPPAEGIGVALLDRLRRAAAKR